ncbi:FliI/YscN family ATPase (plasmid) [Bradyrhizobium sp. 62B]|uniref:FliI/YscN family ATPase n=1 Tax=Bradyrhizobium sp. 62B TaxID=2898442 RepID=UPI002557F03F|nr:FliI/YscN family ATPase [Bradyrhizobium sp. 62B]
MKIDRAETLHFRGRVVEIAGTIIRAKVPGVRVGDLCELVKFESGHRIPAEIVGVENDIAILTPLGQMQGLSTLTEVIPKGEPLLVPVGETLLGRIVDGLGRPLDESTLGPLIAEAHVPAHNNALGALKRRVVSQPFPVGVRAIDGLLTCGEGQRIGIFAAAGAGKSTLLSMLVRGAAVDVNVIALIGERGREVQEFVQDIQSQGRGSRSIFVVATSDRPAMERAKAAYVATALAEWFRDKSQRVLLVMDSLTRFARAQREIGLAAGEFPARRGFPPSVFANLPQLLERPGNSDRGSITAFYTVLVEGDDMTEPVADEALSILDGHIVLSRSLAMSNHYPPIDILTSTSRIMSRVVSPQHQEMARTMRVLLANYQELEVLIQVGDYKKGADPDADEAVAKIDGIRRFLRQSTREQISFEAMLSELQTCLS